MQHSRCEHFHIHMQEANQQEQEQGQEEEGPEAPVGRGTSEPPQSGAQEGPVPPTLPTSAQHHPCYSSY